MKLVTLLVLIVILCDHDIFPQINNEKIELGYKISIKSEYLNETRTIFVHLPKDYYNSKNKYPIVYILDGEEYFLPAVGIINFLSTFNLIPESIVIGIPHSKNRINEYTHSATEQYPSGGGTDQFLDFIEKELFDYIVNNYRTMDYKTLCGHSLGGLCVIYTLINRPHLFNSYLGISSSLYWDNSSVLKNLDTMQEKLNKLDIKLHFSVESLEVDHSIASEELSILLRKQKNPNLDWKFDVIEEETHSTIWIKGFYEGMKYLSPYNIPKNKLNNGFFAVIEYCEKMDMEISLGLLTKVYNDFYSIGRIIDAISALEYGINMNPEYIDFYHRIGDAYRDLNKFDIAKKWYDKGLEVAQMQESIYFIELFRNHLDDLRKIY